jgi:uncharacterized protein YvpB
MFFYWLLITILAILVAIFRKDLRFRMVLAATLSVPILLVTPLTNPNFLQIVAGQDLFIFLASRLVIAASFAALASAIYEVFFHRKVTPVQHPHRSRLLWLVSGLLVLTILLLFHQSLIVAILAGLVVDLTIVLILRPDLVWDVIFSGFSMGVLYLAIFLVTFRGFPGGLENLWFTNTYSGLTLWSLPIEELLAVILFGSLVGPLYVAIKVLQPPVRAPHLKTSGKKRSKLTILLHHVTGSFHHIIKIFRQANRIVMSNDFKRHHLKPKIAIGSLVITLSLFIIASGVYYFVIPPKVSASTPQNNISSVGLVGNINITFNKPVNRDIIRFAISPQVSGNWHYSGGVLANHLFNIAIFTPDKPLTPDQQYTVKVTNTRNFMNTFQGSDSQFSFRTEILPKIDHASISDGQTGILSTDPINVYLSQKNNKVLDFHFQIEPKVDFTATLSADSQSYILKFNQALVQGTVYKLSAQGFILPSSGNPAPQDSWQISFTTKEPPGLAASSPQGTAVLIDTKQITLDFAEPMAQNEVANHISISPSLAGSWQWQTATKLVYNIKQKLSFATTYTILVTQGFHDQKGGFIASDLSIGFTTIGKVIVDSFFPSNGSSNVATDATIDTAFNQAVDHTSAQSAFSVSPVTAGSFSWSGDKMTFTPTGLNKDSTYTVDINAGVKSIAGQNSTTAFSSSFSTVPSSIILDIPIDYQDRALSCEAASLKMALNYRGAGVTEDNIMAIVGFDPTIRNGNIWGNPYKAFVGDINGREDTTGYGVYWDPIARAANIWRKAVAFTGWTTSQIAGAIAGDNPVVLWGTYGNASRDDWQTPDGTYILAWKGEHARTVIGFTGTADNPTTFIVNDPIAGRITWTNAQLTNNMSAFGGSGVVVY